MTFLIGSHQE